MYKLHNISATHIGDLSIIHKRESGDLFRRCLAKDSNTKILHEALKLIINIPELQLSDYYSAALFSINRDGIKSIVEHEGHSAPPRNGCDFPFEAKAIISRRAKGHICYRFPLMTADQDVIGLVTLSPQNGIPLTSCAMATIVALLADVALLIERQRATTINAHLAELAGLATNEIYLFDADTLKIFQANRAAQVRTGYRPDQIFGRKPSGFKADLSEEDYRNLLKPLLDGTSATVTFNGHQKRRDGSIYQAAFQLWRFDSDDGAILIESVVDDSDHKRVLNLLQATFNGFPGGIYVLDGKLNLVIANRRLYELMDIPEELFGPGCNFEDIVRYNAYRGEYGEGDPEETVCERVERMKLFTPHAFERIRPDGSVLEVRASPLTGGGIVVTILDVTVRHRAEQELLRHRDRLEEAVRQRTTELEDKSQQLSEALEHERHVNLLQRQFVSMASHEFRTPLAIIDGAAQRILRRKGEWDRDFVEDKASQIRLAVNRVIELMESILSSAKLESGNIRIKPEACPVIDILFACCKHRQDISTWHNIVVDLGDLPAEIVADKSAIEQIFANLLSNAVKYSPHVPEIRVEGWREGDIIHIAFKDKGIGIDQDDLPKMFERYFRARTSTGIAGTGIGLNLVKQIAELHGGSISIESRKGVGSTFTVTLPISGPQNSSGTAAA